MNKFNENKKLEQSNNFEEFQTIDLEYLNHEKEFTPEQRQEAEQSREQARQDSYEALMGIYEKQTDRENSNIFDGQREAKQRDEAIFIQDYSASFATFGGRDGYTHRPNHNYSPDQLEQQITQIKSEKRKISKFKTFVRAIGLRDAA